MRKYNLVIIIIVFLFLYEPPIFNFNILHILGLISIGYILFHFTYFNKNFSLYKIMLIYFFMFTLVIYMLTVTNISNNNYTNILSPLFWILDIIPISIMLSIYFKRNKYSFYDFINVIIYVSFIQAVISILTFSFSSLQELTIAQLINYGYYDYLIELSKYRIYGFASNLTYSTPILQSVIAVIAVYLSITKNIKYLFFVPFILFSSFVNARTSIIIFLSGLLLIFLTYRIKNLNNFMKFSTRFVLMSLSIWVLFLYLNNSSSETFTWVMNFFDEISIFIRGGIGATQYSYYNYFTSSNTYVLPEGIYLFFGHGFRIMSPSKYAVFSDVGYINDIWLGGLFYSISIYVFFLSILLSVLKSHIIDKKLKIYLTLLLVNTLIISNFKGYIFGMNNLTNFLFLLYFFIVIHNFYFKPSNVYRFEVK